MDRKQYFASGIKTSGLIILISIIISQPGLSSPDSVHGKRLMMTSTISGEIITVSNSSEDINGDISDPAALIADPGPDGISLPEAMLAADASSAYDIINFAPSLNGSVINIYGSLPVISHGNMMIDGDIDNDGIADITIDGSTTTGFNGLQLYGASHVIIKGLVIQNFPKHGILISPDSAIGAATVEDLVIYQNTISSDYAAISVGSWSQDHTVIRDVEIDSNHLLNSDGGVSVIAGMGEGANDNEITDLTISNNTISNPGYHIAIFLSPSATAGLSRNTITDIKIIGNQISDHTNTSILVDASNQSGCNDNLVDNLLIAENKIDGTPVTIEMVSESGTLSSGNTLSNVTIIDNVLTSGGIHFGGATGFNASNNTISSVVIERNTISSSYANGIYMVAGSGGAHDNLFEHIAIRNNFINGSRDAGILLHADNATSPNNTINDVAISNQTLVNNGVASSWAGGLNINSKDSSNIISGVNVSNTILWGNGGDDAIRGSLVPDSVSYSLLNDILFLGSDNNFYLSPEFTDPSSGDYHLQSSSPCVDSGDPAGVEIGAKDLDSNFRLWDGDGDSTAVVDRGAWEYNAIAMQEIVVSGNGIPIINEDSIPVSWDGSDFGAATVFEDTLEQSFTIDNIGAAALNLSGEPKVQISGAFAADFTVTVQPQSPVAGGESVSFTIAFSPSATGLREATVSILNNDSDESPFSFAIQGTGLTPSLKTYIPLILR